MKIESRKRLNLAVAVKQELEIFTRKPGDVFDPYSDLTRAQIAKVLLKTLEIADEFKIIGSLPERPFILKL
ncbi:hypothetical protein LAV73_21840 [Lysinibacillus xylanilyticus]|uniref:hypothetical protein n=1 Tax=Lysinibacillus xylanilyticus TaxID=582475 RepID=UPI002B24BBC4|nr:hypothetical protein [Lysinibacillus xylanilyticus]MEB2282574.1 hypothetical protein [Lysinibacillus xylanilyticus]